MRQNYLIKMGSMVIFIAGILMCIAIPANALKFSDNEKNRLKAGETVIRELPSSGQKGFYGGSGYSVIDAPVEKVWEVLTTWKNYREIFPYTKECSPISTKGNRTLLKMVTGHPIVSVQYYLNIESDKSQNTIKFELVPNYPHDLDMLQGFWRLFPQPGGRTLAAYVVSTQAPAGLVLLVGPELAHEAIQMLLSIPGDVRKWMDAQRKR